MICINRINMLILDHYNDVRMITMTSQITSLMVVYSAVYSDADQRKHQSSASLAFVWGIRRDRWIPRTKSQLRGKCFHLMTSSCVESYLCHYGTKADDLCHDVITHEISYHLKPHDNFNMIWGELCQKQVSCEAQVITSHSICDT